MTTQVQQLRSAPARLLNEIGTVTTYRTLQSATQGLTDELLEILEEELSFFDETGLIGVQMSALLSALGREPNGRAA